MDEAIYRDKAGFHEGFLVKLHLQSQRQVDMECVPFCQSKSPARCTGVGTGGGSLLARTDAAPEHPGLGPIVCGVGMAAILRGDTT